ncbi:hypothetical protein ABT367_33255, partial [Streptomyces mesophilus]
MSDTPSTPEIPEPEPDTGPESAEPQKRDTPQRQGADEAVREERTPTAEEPQDAVAPRTLAEAAVAWGTSVPPQSTATRTRAAAGPPPNPWATHERPPSLFDG